MKYFVLLLVLIIGGLAYVRFEQPQMWNDYLLISYNALKDPATANGSTTDPDATSGSSPAAVPPKTQTFINPDTTNYLNPDHVRPVQQPEQAPASNSAPANTLDTNAPSTNKVPATN
jgi:hypothetical protein